MILLQGQNLARHFGPTVLFENIHFTIQEKERIALVGRNGAGKSTLLKILAGIEAPDEGSVSKRKGITIGYLDQHTAVDSTKTIWEEMLSVFDSVIRLNQEAEQAAHALADERILADEKAYEEALSRYDQLQLQLQQKNAYGYESELRSVLHGFKFYEEDYHRPIEQLSGGQKTRLALAKTLLEKNDVLILDEPTNHLDIDTLAWLEEYLLSYPGSILVVSHDRYFLDKIATGVYEISNHTIHVYKGNYSYYQVEKAARLEQEMKQYEKQQAEIAKLEDYVARNLVRASTTKMAQSRRKRLEKMDRLSKPKTSERSAHFSFPIASESGNVVLLVEDGVIGYEPEHPLASGIQLDVRKHQAIAIVGPNGIGKSTLLKSLVQQLPLLSGSLRYGTNVQRGYYDQELQNLSANKTVLAEIWDLHPTMNEKDVRSILGSFLFRGEDVEKSVAMLSGGEKARLSLCKLSLEENNLLMLDEPTNHLDIDSKEVLENALIEFDGTLIFISHDRYFINRIATSVLELSETGSKYYIGDYDYYRGKKNEEAERARLEQEQTATVGTAPKVEKTDYHSQKERAKAERKLQREVEATEKAMMQLEEQIEELEAKLTLPEVFHDHEEVATLSKEIATLRNELDGLYLKWETDTLSLEELIGN